MFSRNNNYNEMENYITIEGNYQIKENVNIGEYIHFDLTPIVPKKKSPQSVTYKISIKDLEIYKNVVNLPENYCPSSVKKINEFNEDLENFIPQHNSLGLLSSGTVGTYLDLKNGEFICDRGLLREGVEIRGKITGRKISSYSSMFTDETSTNRNLYSTLEYLPYEENLYHNGSIQTQTDYFYMSLWEKMIKCMADDKNGYRERVMPALSFSVNKSSFNEWGISLGGTDFKQQWATENVGIRALIGDSDTDINSSVINIRPKQLNIKSWGNTISLTGGGDNTAELIKIKSNNASFIAKDNNISLKIEDGDSGSEISLINTQGKTLVPTSLNIKNMEVGLNFEQVEEGIGDGDVANSRIKVSFTYQEPDGEGNLIEKTTNYYITRKFFQYLIDNNYPGVYN